MSASTGADILIETLIDWGVEVVFGFPGDGIDGIMESLRTRKDKIRFIQVRHEESAAFMPCAYAKYTPGSDWRGCTENRTRCHRNHRRLPRVFPRQFFPGPEAQVWRASAVTRPWSSTGRNISTASSS